MNIELEFLNLLQNIHNPILDKFMVFITKLGDMGIIWLLLTIILLMYSKKRKSGIVLAVAICIDIILCNGMLKHIFARIRPCDVNTSIALLIARPNDFSFPSGHTAVSFTAVTALYLSKEKKLWKPALILSVLIAFSRMYLYVHYPSDILGGVIIGIVSGYTGYFIVGKFISLKQKSIC